MDANRLSEHEIYSIIQRLADACDGASSLDGQGFNKQDSDFGKSLADSIEKWGRLTEKQMAAARKLCGKYWRQWTQTIPQVEAPPVESEPSIDIESQLAELRDSLSVNQREAFALALIWFKNGGLDPFLLKGFAGTGKTFTVQRIVKALQLIRPGLRVAICAPTHKARHVLEEMAQNAGLTSAHISTLHSLLHVMPGDFDAKGNQKLKENEWSQEPHYKEFGLVVIDESSMIDEALYDFVVKQKVPTIFMGDPAQLPPVRKQDEDEESVEPGKDSPVFSLPCGIELTEVKRYEGAIAEYVTELRQDINTQFPPRLKERGNIRKFEDPDVWLSTAIEAIQGRKGPNDVRVLAWSNRRVATINNAIRQAVFFGVEEDYQAGEMVTAKEIVIKHPSPFPSEFALQSDEKEIVMYSCAEARIGKVEVILAKFQFPWIKDPQELKLYRLDLTTDLGRDVTLSVPYRSSVDRESWNLVKETLVERRKSILAEDSKIRSRLWRDWYEVQEKLNLCFKGNEMMSRLQPAYALTVHQSQGSTFNRVFVDSTNIYGCRNNKTRNQLLYVAYSRASEQLNVLSRF